MPARLRTAYGLALSLVLLLPVSAQKMLLLPKEAVAEMEKLAREAMTRSGTPALSVSAGKQGEVLWSKAYGLADVELGAPAGNETRFRTASIAKSMTAVAVVQLAEAGKIDLDGDIAAYVPEWKGKPSGTTVRRLLGHLGGIRHYKGGGESAGTAFYPTLAASLELFAGDPLVHEPGSKYRYTTYGYTLLGRAVETASGMSFREYMAGRVWGPASMKHTGIDDQRLVVKGRAKGYSKMTEDLWKSLPADWQGIVAPGDVVNAALHDTSMKIPGGGMLTTSSDLVRFGLALLGGGLVSKESAELLWTPLEDGSGTSTNYGLGFGIDRASEGRIVQHSGGQAGASSMFMLDRESGAVVGVMANMDGAGVGGLARKILDIVAAAEVVEGEPDRIRVAHVLVAFRGAARSSATRTREEAEALAGEILARARAGEDFTALMKAHSDDPGGGVYGLLNAGVNPEPGFYPRGQMVPAFGNVGFSLRPGEVGIAPHDTQTSPFGWHVIKRIE